MGGGDSFASGLIYGFLAGFDAQACVEYGAAHGALAMTTPGDTSMATLAEVKSLVAAGSARARTINPEISAGQPKREGDIPTWITLRPTDREQAQDHQESTTFHRRGDPGKPPDEAQRGSTGASGRPRLPEGEEEGRAAEAGNRGVGVKCGIMDQMISAVGETDRAVLIDCRDLSGRSAPLPAGTSVVILDTMTRRGLVDSAYNERRRQCSDAARHLGVTMLRDVDVARLVKAESDLEGVVYRRARHVVTENQRTVDATGAMTRGDAKALGRLMNESHNSLRDDFEVSNRELNLIVDLARSQPGCFGARMTGAGFGGCAVALVATEQVPAFVQQVAPAYTAASGKVPSIYITPAVAGASVIDSKKVN